jgi:hypothetical protein
MAFAGASTCLIKPDAALIGGIESTNGFTSPMLSTQTAQLFARYHATTDFPVFLRELAL